MKLRTQFNFSCSIWNDVKNDNTSYEYIRETFQENQNSSVF